MTQLADGASWNSPTRGSRAPISPAWAMYAVPGRLPA
jgi:hypothetical protein